MYEPSANFLTCDFCWNVGQVSNMITNCSSIFICLFTNQKFGARRLEMMEIRANLTYPGAMSTLNRDITHRRSRHRVIECGYVVPPAAAEQCCNELLASISNYIYALGACTAAASQNTPFCLQKTTISLQNTPSSSRTMTMFKKSEEDDDDEKDRKKKKKKNVYTERRRRRTMGKASI